MQDFLPLITGGCGAIVVLSLWVYAFYSGKIHSDREYAKLEAENDRLRDAFDRQEAALETERRTVNETAQVAAVSNQLITALVTVAAGGKPRAPELTAKDLGL